MAKKSAPVSNITHRDIINRVRQGDYAPIYLLQGEETYYIDRVSEYIAQNALTEDERGFNLVTIYCTAETTPGDIINAARRYPMMARRQVVVVREMQNLKKADELQYYCAQPLATTVLILCHKHGTLDRRTHTYAAIAKNGIVFDSPKVKEGHLPAFIDDYLRRHNATIEDRARMMLGEAIGADLSRLASELDKLLIALPADTPRITAQLVEQNTGISREYNVYELRRAICDHDIVRANRILDYFNTNPRSVPPILIIASLFSFFSNLMLLYYAPDRSESGLLSYLDLRSPWQLNDYRAAARHCTPRHTLTIISQLRLADVRLKGVDNGNTTPDQVMRELLYTILH